MIELTRNAHIQQTRRIRLKKPSYLQRKLLTRDTDLSSNPHSLCKRLEIQIVLLGVRIMRGTSRSLLLSNHPLLFIIEDNHLNNYVCLGRTQEFFHSHTKGSIIGNIDNNRLGVDYFRTYGRWKAKSYCPQ